MEDSLYHQASQERRSHRLPKLEGNPTPSKQNHHKTYFWEDQVNSGREDDGGTSRIPIGEVMYRPDSHTANYHRAVPGMAVTPLRQLY